MILEETYNLLKDRYPTKAEELTITEARIGLFLTAVRLSDGCAGVAATWADGHPHCGKKERDFGSFTPLRIRGATVGDLFETGKQTNLLNTLRTAVLNALSSTLITPVNYNILKDCDPIDLIDLHSGKTITLVGAFQSYMRKISEAGNKLTVLELCEGALSREQRKFYIPAQEYKKVLPGSDIVIITGQALVNNTIDRLLNSVSADATVIVTGPSCSLLPDSLFAARVAIVGATRITKPEVLFDIAGEGGTGYHLFEYCAEKICIINGNHPQVK